MLELALGVSLATGPAFAGVAMATPGVAPVTAAHAIAQSLPRLDRPLGAAASLDRPVGPAPRPVTVRRGDSLWLIAERGLGRRPGSSEIAKEWPRWYAANRTVIGDDPDLIRPGQRLRPPGA
jgi:nucleoid-associated protein YgaU